MYYLLYGFLFLVSLLPFFILYAISDFAFFIIFHVLKYRRDVVADNLLIAFPEKSEAERLEISRKFYKNLTDTFIETIKLLSLSEKAFLRRVSVDMEPCDSLVRAGKNIQLHSGHQMNWEYAHRLYAKESKATWVGVYMKIKNRVMDRLFLSIRSVYGCLMVSAQGFSKEIRKAYSGKYMLALIADQSPGNSGAGYWLNFFSKPTSFIAGPDRGAIKNGTAVVFVNFVKIKRGYYTYENVVVTEDASGMQPGELTILYRNFLEKCIRAQPDNYLWSHRRWKVDLNEEHLRRWIDTTPPVTSN